MPGENDEQLASVLTQYYRKLIHIYKLMGSNRVSSARNLEDDHKTNSSLWKIVAAKNKKKKTRKKRREKVKKRPRKKSASLKRKKLLKEAVSEIIKESPQQADEGQGSFSQQHAVNHQFHLQSFSPQIPPNPPNTEMDPPGNNMYRGRGNWSPFYRNSYPYERNAVGNRRRRSHLDDIYLPNYEDEDLEERNDFNQLRFRNRPYYWNRNNPSYRSDNRNSNRTLSFVNRAQFREPDRNDAREAKTNQSSTRDGAASSASGPSTSTGGCVKNSERKESEPVKTSEVNSNSLQKQIQSDFKTIKDIKREPSDSCGKLNDCESNVQCHNLKTEDLKTEDVGASSHSSDLEDLNKLNGDSSVSVSSEKADVKRRANFPDKDGDSGREMRKIPEICETQDQNPFAALNEMDSDEEFDCFNDFITIDAIDTSKSYLSSSPSALDNYEILDMDISPLKRKSEDEEEETTKKARYDSLYFKINSDKLLNEINEVLRENKLSFERSSVEIGKRFRSKSLTLHDIVKNTPIVKSSSVDSIDKNKSQVSYDFDLKTNLLLLLNQKSSDREADASSSFNNVHKVLKGHVEKLSVQNKSSSIKTENNNNSSENSGTTKEVKGDFSEEFIEGKVPVEEKKKSFQASNNQREDNTKKLETATDRVKAEPEFSITNNLNNNENIEESTEPIPSTRSTIENKPSVKLEPEEINNCPINSKRKYSVGREEQSKKICLDSVDDNVARLSSAPDEDKTKLPVKKEEAADGSAVTSSVKLEELHHDGDTNQSNVASIPLCSTIVSKDSFKKESLLDIEEELKSLLAMDDLIKEEKTGIPLNKHVSESGESKSRGGKKITADPVNTDEKTSDKKKLPKENAPTDAKCTERCNAVERKQFRDTDNSKKPLEKTVQRSSTEKTNLQRRDVKQIEDGPSSNTVQSKPKDEQMTKPNSAEKKQKCKENNITISNSVAVSNTISRPAANKPIPQNVSKSKTASYYERFKRIQSLFGSDSESEMDEEISKTDNYKTSSNRKMYEESIRKEVQIKKQAVTGPATNPISPGESQTPADFAIREFSRNKINQSSKESSKTLEKRRCSVPITVHAPSLKFPNGVAETANPIINKSEPAPSSVGKPKLIEKKRRETLPVSLIGGTPKNDKSDKDKNYKKDEMGIVSVVNHKLKDPRKEHQRYKNCGRKEQTSETSSSKKSTVASDSCKAQTKDSEKRKIPHKNEKKDVSLPITASKTSNEDKKRNNCAKKPKNLRERDHPPKKETSQTESIVNQLQLQSKLSKAERNFPTIKSVASKVLSEIESKIRTGIQEPVQLNLLQCSALSRNRFPMLQRASSCVQENDCCDRAVTLENVDVNEKIDIVRQASDREDDVIEVKLDIPIIDLTDDAAKENSDEMITLYRSEETINNSLDVQTTSESISPSILKNKPSQDKSNAKEELTSPNSSSKSPALYISPINEAAKASPPPQFTFNVTRSVNETQNRSPPTLPQTVKPVTDTQNVHTSQSHPGQEAGSDNTHIGLTRSCGGNFVEVTKQVNPSPPIPVEQRQEGVVGPPTRTPLQRQQKPFPPPNPLTQLQMKISNLSKPVNNSTPCRQHPLLYQQIMMNSENRTTDSNGATRTNSHAVHSPMRHTDDEGPAPMHEISVQEIGRAGVVLMRHLLLNEHVRKARWAYKSELLKLQKHMSAAMRIELFHFENYCSERDRRLHKDLLRELKGLNLTGRSSNVKSAELLMENVYRVLRGIVEDLALWRVYLMLDILMQPEMSEYMAVPFLRDLFNYVTFVAAKIRSALSATGQQANAQVVTQPQDPFTPNQRKILEWQIKQYISICSIQKRLTEQLQNGIPNRPANNNKAIPQNIQLLPNYSSQVKSMAVLSNNRQPVNKINPNVTIHQNITIRPVDVMKPNVPPNASTGYVSLNSTDPRTFNETFRIRLPYTAPYETTPPSTDVPLQEQNSSQPVEEANIQVPERAQPSPITDQVTTESTPETNRCRSADPTDSAITPGEAEAVTQTDVVIVKQEKEASLLTDREIETIDLTWINDIDPNQLQSEMEFIAVKKEEPLDDKEAEGEVNEEAFAVAPSPADSGISSPPIQVEYDETVFSNRSCICEKVAEYVCGCMMAMYCSVECQLEDWGDHKDVCQKYKSKATHSNKT